MFRKGYVFLFSLMALAGLVAFVPREVSSQGCVENNIGFCAQTMITCRTRTNTLYCCYSQEECDTKLLKNIVCGTDGNGIMTAIGCIPVLGSSNDFVASLLKWATGVGGGIAFILMLYAGFMIMTAQGNPERLQAGKELLTSAIAGVILLVLSVFILKFAGVDILGLGNFGFGK